MVDHTKVKHMRNYMVTRLMKKKKNVNYRLKTVGIVCLMRRKKKERTWKRNIFEKDFCRYQHHY
jgi:hypothetical protein